MAVKPARLRVRLRRLRILIMDVDGVLTDAGMYYGESGDELKKFNTRDGHGITLLHAAGYRTAIATRERTSIVERRAAKLGIAEVHQGVMDKRNLVHAILERLALAPGQSGYVGDDVGDLEVMQNVGLAVAVADAVPAVKRAAHYVTRLKGGEGAVREVCDLILAARVLCTR
jgi:YrbI family 3-deoxy-D-manno-octulosonate 8-phosphate phosphatase